MNIHIEEIITCGLIRVITLPPLRDNIEVAIDKKKRTMANSVA